MTVTETPHGLAGPAGRDEQALHRSARARLVPELAREVPAIVQRRPGVAVLGAASRQKRTLKWMFFDPAPRQHRLPADRQPHARDGRQRDRRPDRAPVAVRHPHLVLGGVGPHLRVHPAAARRPARRYSIEFDMRVWLYTHIQSADLRALDKVATGQLVTRSITDLQLVEQLLRIFPTLIGFAPLLIALGMLVIILNPSIGILAVLGRSGEPAACCSRFSRALRGLSWAELNERAEVAAHHRRAGARHPRGQGVRTRGGRRPRKVAGRHRDGLPVLDDPGAPARQLRRRDEAVPLLIQCALLALGAWRLEPRRAEPRHVPARVPALHRRSASLASVFDELSSAWQYLRGAQDRLAEMLALELASRSPTAAWCPAPSSGPRARRHHACSSANAEFLHGLDLAVVPPGGVRRRARGARLRQVDARRHRVRAALTPNRGDACLDGLALEELDPSELRRSIRVVAEEPLLLAASLRDNLRWARRGEIDDESSSKRCAPPAPTRSIERDATAGSTGTSATAASPSREGSASASPSPARWSPGRACSCSTTHSPR